MDQLKLTQKQYDELIERRIYLDETAIPKNRDEIEKAKEFGDLSENAEYQAAKDLQSRLFEELSEIKGKINKASIIEKNTNFDKVEIGHEVTVYFQNENKYFTFSLIGENGDGENEIDLNAKLGNAIYHKSIGDKVSYEANDPSLGELEFEIISIE